MKQGGFILLLRTFILSLKSYVLLLTGGKQPPKKYI